MGTIIPLYYIFGLLVFCSNPTQVYVAYGQDRKQMVLSGVIDSLGLGGMVETGQINPSWWYLSAAHFIILLAPFLIILGKKCRCMKSICFFLVFVCLWQKDNVYLDCVLSALIGATMVDAGAIVNLGGVVGKNSFVGEIKKILFLAGCVILYVLFYYDGRINWYILGALGQH